MIVIEVWRVLPFVLGGIFQTAFVLVYSVPRFGAGRWWRDFVGRALFFKAVALASILLLSTTSLTLILLSGVGELSWSISYSSSYRAPLPGRYGALIKVVALTAAVFYWLLLLTIVYQFASLLHERRVARTSKETRNV